MRVLALRRAEDTARRREDALVRQIGLMTEVSVTVQESLDMGIVLPAVLAEMMERLSLASISVVPGSLEGGVEVLSLGRRPIALPGQRWSSESSTAEAGQLVRLPLHRATRTLGHLEVVPAAGLDAAEFASLRTTADLLAGAWYNAELYEREQESVRRLRELDELKDDFLSTVSHELRTPLSVLVGFVSLLNKDWDRLNEDVRREAINKMQRHVASLTNLVNDLLDFISERRATAAVSEAISLDAEVGELAEQLRPLCHSQQLTVVTGEHVPAWTDRRALERIIGNLVSNAAKYSPPGTTITVKVEGAEDAEDAIVSISDQGPGIRREDRDRIFERFYRGDSDAARSTRGSGIGLAVAFAWMRAVGARLEVTTQTGRGTTMTVHFPKTPEQPVADAGRVVWLDASAVEKEFVQ
jgi:signal transduction histidine kinase